MTYDVIIVGAGPIGLSNAWGIKAINPNIKILVIEKYTEYQRKHTLITQAEQLKELMEITGTTQNATLSELYEDLLADPHIRTITLEQAFKSVAEELGVDIQYQTITPENITDELITKHPEARLIIGADGTHSQVSQAFFPENNQIKHSIDYVLQLRYEVKGNSHKIDTMPFLHMMIEHELIANEYVGHFDKTTQSTPVTMQAMITKGEFNALKLATSKDPIQLYDAKKSEQVLPANLSKFIHTYLKHKRKQGLNIDNDSVRVSVNEAPATRADQVYTTYQNRTIVLAGDASLGLSYFKGLKAGLKSTSQLLSTISPWLRREQDIAGLMKDYQIWFNTFAESKIQEVKSYSSRNIHVPWKAIRFIHQVEATSYASSAASRRMTTSFTNTSANTSLNILDSIWNFFGSSASLEDSKESSISSKKRTHIL